MPAPPAAHLRAVNPVKLAIKKIMRVSVSLNVPKANTATTTLKLKNARVVIPRA